MLNVHCTTAFTADLYQCSWGLNLSLSHYYKTVLLFNWHLGILYTVPWFTLHIIYLFFPSCLSSCKEKLGLHCSSDYVMQVFITHFLVCSGVPLPLFSVCLKVSVLCKGHLTASKIVCCFSRKTRVLHQEVKNTIAGCCDESSNPLRVQSSCSAIRGMVVFFF